MLRGLNQETSASQFTEPGIDGGKCRFRLTSTGQRLCRSKLRLGRYEMLTRFSYVLAAALREQIG